VLASEGEFFLTQNVSESMALNLRVQVLMSSEMAKLQYCACVKSASLYLMRIRRSTSLSNEAFGAKHRGDTARVIKSTRSVG
jgi:hypothetical protein